MYDPVNSSMESGQTCSPMGRHVLLNGFCQKSLPEGTGKDNTIPDQCVLLSQGYQPLDGKEHRHDLFWCCLNPLPNPFVENDISLSCEAFERLEHHSS